MEKQEGNHQNRHEHSHSTDQHKHSSEQHYDETTIQEEHTHPKHENHENHENHGHHGHGDMVKDFKKRFFISLILTIPILALSPMIQHFLGVDWRFDNDLYILFVLSSVVFFYGGWPFLTGGISELKEKNPGMMTLIALAITIAYSYSTLVVFGWDGNQLFWELATLVDIMLLGHWIEMRSIMGASYALEQLVKLMPSEAHKLDEQNQVRDVPLSEIRNKGAAFAETFDFEVSFTCKGCDDRVTLSDFQLIGLFGF